MTLKSDTKLEEKLTCGLEDDMRNSGNFHQTPRKSKNWNFNGILLSKVEMYEPKIYRGEMCNDN